LIPLPRELVAQELSGRVLRGPEGPPFSAVFTDTRQPAHEGLFVAVQGERFDAHAFIDKAIDSGAKGAVISRPEAIPDSTPDDFFVLAVDDTRRALGDLGHLVRRRHPGSVVAITGSVGKTTVKDMVAHALCAFGKVGKTPGNYNNDIGLPLSFFSMDGDEAYLVLELGMNAPGEIELLTTMAAPDVGLVTGAAAAHLAFFSGVDAIADAKAELYDAMREGAVAVANGDDPRILSRAAHLHGHKLITYGVADNADVRLVSADYDTHRLAVVLDCRGHEVTFNLNALGRHNALNAAAAMAVVVALGLDPHQAAASLGAGFVAGKHRLQIVNTAQQCTILDDCYNANPTSMRASLDTFKSLTQGIAKRIAVLGTMLELGPNAPQLHREIGAFAAESGVTHLFVVGSLAEHLAQGARESGLQDVREGSDVLALVDDIRSSATAGSWLLLKGSRNGRLERVLDLFDRMETA
jgi:UDP-N-acetylmuramoyl-tripeptide--D-alanyl-D-alanine ligase